jgi:uncharacterized protein YdcH (DUF465 family)
MPTTQKSQQKQTKATQKVGGSTKKPVTKAMEGGKVAPSKGKMTRGGSAKGGVVNITEAVKGKMPVTMKKFTEEIERLDNRINTFTTNIQSQIDTNIKPMQKQIAALQPKTNQASNTLNETNGRILRDMAEQPWNP